VVSVINIQAHLRCRTQSRLLCVAEGAEQVPARLQARLSAVKEMPCRGAHTTRQSIKNYNMLSPLSFPSLPPSSLFLSLPLLSLSSPSPLGRTVAARAKGDAGRPHVKRNMHTRECACQRSAHTQRIKICARFTVLQLTKTCAASVCRRWNSRLISSADSTSPDNLARGNHTTQRTEAATHVHAGVSGCIAHYDACGTTTESM
jgi:hypothetical protein